MQLFIAILLMPLGIGILYMGIKGIMNTRRFLKNAVETIGEVVEIYEEISTDSDDVTSTFYHPIIKFRDSRNQVFTFKSNIGRGDRHAFKQGQTLKILYDYKQPESAKIKSFTGIWSGTIVLVVIGGLMILTSTYLLLITLQGS
jgi:Protein of unknown function (DUF3592)